MMEVSYFFATATRQHGQVDLSIVLAEGIALGLRRWSPDDMARPPRIDFPNAVCHVARRGNERGIIS